MINEGPLGDGSDADQEWYEDFDDETLADFASGGAGNRRNF